MKREAQYVLQEIKLGEQEYALEEVEVVDDSEERVWKKNKPEVSSEESRKHVEVGIEQVKELLELMTGRMIGAQYATYFYNTSSHEFLIAEDDGKDIVLDCMAYQGWTALFDDQFAMRGRSSRESISITYHIGQHEVGRVSYSSHIDAEAFHYVFDKPVASEDFGMFLSVVNGMLDKNCEEKHIDQPSKRQLPADVQETITEMRFDRRIAEVLKEGTIVPAGKVNFRHGPYGPSYFGSGGGYGSVKAYELSSWRNSVVKKKNISTESGDNGFMAGPVAAYIEPNTIIIAKGGDSIGDGRSWEEIYICE